jgi:hypothetical protein
LPSGVADDVLQVLSTFDFPLRNAGMNLAQVRFTGSVFSRGPTIQPGLSMNRGCSSAFPELLEIFQGEGMVRLDPPAEFTRRKMESGW